MNSPAFFFEAIEQRSKKESKALKRKMEASRAIERINELQELELTDDERAWIYR